MKFETQYRLVLWKSYFDRGLSLTNYIKYPIGFFALSTMNLKATMILAGIYAIICPILGFAWFRYGWVKAEMEVSNQYNLFVEELRKRFIKDKSLNKR